jgi:shikimate dehydrogenase
MEPSGRRRAAVLGSPVAHSLSPTLHRTAYGRLGLAGWEYSAIEVVGADALATLIDAGPWAGLSLTMPLKTLAQPLVDEISPLARATGSVNTITFARGRRLGDNTDVDGIALALAEARVHAADRAVVLGGGATAASAVAALGRLGAAPALVLRSPARGTGVLEAADRLGVEVSVVPWSDQHRVAGLLAGADVVVSTVPAQAGPAVVAAIDAAIDAAPTAENRRGLGVLLDVVYHPWPTGPARSWQDGGGVVVGGLAMLLHQAVAQVRLMTGREVTGADVEAMRRAGQAELDRRAE